MGFEVSRVVSPPGQGWYARARAVVGLGNMIAKIRADRQPESLVNCLTNLADINTYTRRYMHGENPRAATESVSTDELIGFVGKLLEITGTLAP